MDQRELQEMEENRQRWLRVDEIIESHVPVLARKYKQCVYINAYGIEVCDAWDKEAATFIRTVVAQDIPASWLDANRNRIIKEITARTKFCTAFEAAEPLLGEADVTTLSPTEFELMVVDLLNQFGWYAHPTSTTGDQGIDIIASLNGKRAVFQCKLYSQAVGNTAVQEIIAGRDFEKADMVSNANYTPSARQLASAAGVYLLHHTEVSSFAEKVRLATNAKK
ncbi:restriction endonuclease [Aromatoleum evansii]|uniref:restriction endonuclease n=1 Tax=Aromatoleum evansii TaxID=59406 RepID=UPI00145F744D|nr:restriction endonuclease [Aromatoleum evansii]NMG30064.1 hypothetical protein [Aromatoleum evansii]